MCLFIVLQLGWHVLQCTGTCGDLLRIGWNNPLPKLPSEVDGWQG